MRKFFTLLSFSANPRLFSPDYLKLVLRGWIWMGKFARVKLNFSIIKYSLKVLLLVLHIRSIFHSWMNRFLWLWISLSFELWGLKGWGTLDKGKCWGRGCFDIWWPEVRLVLSSYIGAKGSLELPELFSNAISPPSQFIGLPNKIATKINFFHTFIP